MIGKERVIAAIKAMSPTELNSFVDEYIGEIEHCKLVAQYAEDNVQNYNTFFKLLNHYARNQCFDCYSLYSKKTFLENMGKDDFVLL